jgi:hypothetical protein
MIYSKKTFYQNDVVVDVSILKPVYLYPRQKVSECTNDLKDIFNFNYLKSNSSSHRGPHL